MHVGTLFIAETVDGQYKSLTTTSLGWSSHQLKIPFCLSTKKENVLSLSSLSASVCMIKPNIKKASNTDTAEIAVRGFIFFSPSLNI